MIKTETGQIPSCQLTAVWTKESKPPVLVHQVTLKGAKESSNFFSIVLDCDSGMYRYDAVCVSDNL